jgi:hypothetical protein
MSSESVILGPWPGSTLPAQRPATRRRQLGLTAAHVASTAALTYCGLLIGEPVRPGTVVQRPTRWPLRRCRVCQRLAPPRASNTPQNLEHPESR